VRRKFKQVTRFFLSPSFRTKSLSYDWKTAFSKSNRHYEFIRLPMGLKNSRAIFQQTLNMVLQEVLGKFCFKKYQQQCSSLDGWNLTGQAEFLPCGAVSY
jgi:hypothetical protein